MDQNEPRINGDWRSATNKVIAEQQLNNLASLLNGKWYRTETVNSYGQRTTRYTVEVTHASDSDVGGAVSSND